jgi:hypothetical protein
VKPKKRHRVKHAVWLTGAIQFTAIKAHLSNFLLLSINSRTLFRTLKSSSSSVMTLACFENFHGPSTCENSGSCGHLNGELKTNIQKHISRSNPQMYKTSLHGSLLPLHHLPHPFSKISKVAMCTIHEAGVFRKPLIILAYVRILAPVSISSESSKWKAKSL